MTLDRRHRIGISRISWFIILCVFAASLPLSPFSGNAQESASTTAEQYDGVTYNEQSGGGGGKNVVRLFNTQDGRLRVKGSVQLNRIPGPTVEPVNLALATASCSDCQTLVVALQINLISRSASSVTPQNAAIAINTECTNCYTVAEALQYVISVDDPTRIPSDVSELIKAMDRELKAIHADSSVTLEEAEARIAAVIAQFEQLGDALVEHHDATTAWSSE